MVTPCEEDCSWPDQSQERDFVLRILLTGRCGFIGSHAALLLCEKRHMVLVLGNCARRCGEKKTTVLKRKRLAIVHGDVLNPEDLSSPRSGTNLSWDTRAQTFVDRPARISSLRLLTQ